MVVGNNGVSRGQEEVTGYVCDRNGKHSDP